MKEPAATDQDAVDAATPLLIVAWLAAAAAAAALDHRVLARAVGAPLGLGGAVFWAGPAGVAWAYRRRSRRAGYGVAAAVVVVGLALTWVARQLSG